MLNTAIILAGGLGTRLKPLTDTYPKPLLPMLGKPLLQHTIEHLARQGITNIILSIGYKADVIQQFFRDGSSLGVRIRYSLETEPLGTGGAVKQAAMGLRTPFFLIWGDNLMDVDYAAMHQTYLQHSMTLIMALTPREDVENFGVARIENGKIVSFVEKPKREQAPSNLINAGAFIIDPKNIAMLPEGASSIERDCFENVAPLGQITPYIHHGQWFPTDTLEKYRLACEQFQPVIDLSSKKVIIADVDDTICDSCQQISPAMAGQVNRLIKQGYQFAFISGTKAEDLLVMISSRVQEEHHLLATTGTHYLHVRNGTRNSMYNHSFNAQEKQDINAAFEKLIAHFNIQTMTTKEDQLQDRDSQITLSAIGRHAPSDLKAAYDPHGEKRKVWTEFLLQHLEEGKYDIKIGGTTSIDVTRKGLDKEWGIREFARHNGIALSQVVFFGDKIYPGGNDFPASRIVDCVAVKNPGETLEKLRWL